jgi:hypothetical protein
MSTPDIMKREWRRMPSLISGGGGIGATIANLLALLFVAGLLPLVMGVAFLEPGPLIAFAALSVFFVASIVTGCFAGTSARRDLRELAASGASAISLGKAGAAALRGWSLGMAVVVVGVVTVNLTNWSGHALLPDRAVSGEALALSLAASVLVALGGALISLRATSTKRAQRNLKIAIVLAILVLTDAVWFYPGDLLKVANLAWIVLGSLLIAAGIVFGLLRKQLAAATVTGS